MPIRIYTKRIPSCYRSVMFWFYGDLPDVVFPTTNPDWTLYPVLPQLEPPLPEYLKIALHWPEIL